MGFDLPGYRGQIATRILKEINQRLQFLIDVGLDYLALDRAAETLSGGEAQRIRLASQIGAGLVGVMYVLDEPIYRFASTRQPAAARYPEEFAGHGKYGHRGRA